MAIRGRVPGSVNPLAAMVFMLFLAACQQASSPATTQRIGPDGGTIQEEGGAALSVPPGALPDQIEFKITSYSSAAGLPENIQPHFFGSFSAATFLPEGLTFEQAVSITIPSQERLTPGDQFPIFTWDEENRAWQETEFIATVDPGGYSYTAEVTHFSTNSGGGTNGAGSPFQGFNMGDEQGCDGFNVTNQLNNWANQFNGAYGGVGGQDARGSCCWELKGEELKVTYECLGTGPITKSNTQGDMTDCDQVERVNKSTGVVGHAGGYTYQTITRCWKRVMPNVTISELPGKINLTCQEDSGQNVNVRVTCGQEGVPQAEVNWSVAGVGEVSPASGTTDPSGYAETTLNVEDEGYSSVQAIVKSCQDEQTHFQTLNTNQACVDTCDQMYLNLHMSFTHSGAGVPWELNDQVSAYIDYTVDDETGAIESGNSEAGHSVSINMTRDNCSATDVTSPSFAMKILNGYATEDKIHVELEPQSMPFSFTMQCEYEHFDEPVDAPVPAYANILASIIGKALKLDIPNRCGGTVDGSGSEGFGADPPVQYNYSVSVQCEDTCSQ